MFLWDLQKENLACEYKQTLHSFLTTIKNIHRVLNNIVFNDFSDDDDLFIITNSIFYWKYLKKKKNN